MGKTISLKVESSDTIEGLKDKIQRKTSFPSIRQHLYYGGNILADDKTLDDYDIQKESNIIVDMKKPSGIGYADEGKAQGDISTIRSYLETYFSHLDELTPKEETLLYINISVPLEGGEGRFGSDVLSTLPDQFDIVNLILFNPAFHNPGVQIHIREQCVKELDFEYMGKWVNEYDFLIYELKQGDKILRIHFPPEFIGEVNLKLHHKPNLDNLTRFMNTNRDNWIMYAFYGCCLKSSNLSDEFNLSRDLGIKECNASSCSPMSGGSIHKKSKKKRSRKKKSKRSRKRRSKRRSKKRSRKLHN